MKNTKQTTAAEARQETKAFQTRLPQSAITRLKTYAVKNQKTIGEALQDIIFKGVSI
ncbi:MAG: hypothetical protein KBA61_02905 [Spirochaetes bacterium]|nr:hypothetical protein [Spirochaetota bacterium]